MSHQLRNLMLGITYILAWIKIHVIFIFFNIVLAPLVWWTPRVTLTFTYLYSYLYSKCRDPHPLPTKRYPMHESCLEELVQNGKESYGKFLKTYMMKKRPEITKQPSANQVLSAQYSSVPTLYPQSPCDLRRIWPCKHKKHIGRKIDTKKNLIRNLLPKGDKHLLMRLVLFTIDEILGFHIFVYY